MEVLPKLGETAIDDARAGRPAHPADPTIFVQYPALGGAVPFGGSAHPIFFLNTSLAEKDSTRCS